MLSWSFLFSLGDRETKNKIGNLCSIFERTDDGHGEIESRVMRTKRFSLCVG